MKRYLVIANRTLGGTELRRAVRERLAAGPCSFWVVVPATRPQGPIRRAIDACEGVLPGDHESVAHAERRLARELAWLRSLGATADGDTGDPDPVVAAEDFLSTHPVDEVILSTLPAGLSRWLGLDLPTRLAHHEHVEVVTVTQADDRNDD